MLNLTQLGGFMSGFSYPNVTTSTLVNQYALYTQGGGGGNSLNGIAYVPQSAGLVAGRKYSYIFFTTGERITGLRNIWDGSAVPSRAYNSGYDPGTSLTFAALYDSYLKGYTHQGSFIYADNTLPYSGGQGFVIANTTYNASDPGKGGIRVFIFDTLFLRYAMNKLRVDTGNVVFDWNDGA